MPLAIVFVKVALIGVNATPFSALQRNFHLQKSFDKPIFDILNRLDIDKKGHKIKASPFGDEH